MIDSVWIFGDSYMYGQELPFHDPALRKQLLDSLGNPVLDSAELLSEPITQKLFDRMSQVEKSIDNYAMLCNQHSMGGYLAGRLGVPCINRARGGYSNDAIMAELINNRSKITADSLVIVGMTYPARETQLCRQDGQGYIACFNNYSAFAKDRQHEQYLSLSTQFGNDMLTKYLHATNHVSRIRELLLGIQHVVIDPVNIYRSSPEITDPIRPWDNHGDPIGSTIGAIEEAVMHSAVLDCIRTYFDTTLFEHTLNHAMQAVRASGARYMELGGHPTKACHDWFVDHCLWPWLTDRGLVA